MATDTEKPNVENPPEENPEKNLDLTVPHATKPDPDPSLDSTGDASLTKPSSLQAPTSKATCKTNSSLKDGNELKGIVTTVDPVAGNDDPLSDIQKKMRRAERFGISVQLSEEEKRNSRAERFGTGSTLQASAASKSEKLKRNARAERFGIPCPSTATENEAKKKARLARFAPVSKTDPLEEDKRKERALRFSNPPSGSLSQDNGKGNIEPKAAIAGKAGGGI